MALGAITVDTMRTAFALYAQSHEAASIQRCWSTWNVLCTFLYTAELIASNPMPMVGRPKLAKTMPKALPARLDGRSDNWPVRQRYSRADNKKSIRHCDGSGRSSST
jgi:site-specific recombinase XerC